MKPRRVRQIALTTNNMEPITWTAAKKKIADLLPLEKNPRKIKRPAIEKMKDRIRKRGFHDVVKLDTANVILSGNVRGQALLELAKEDPKQYATVNALVPSRELTAEERDAVVLESNMHDGEWDNDMLPTFGSEVLLEVGFESRDVDTMLADDEDEEDIFDAEKVVENIKTPTAKKGDVWQLGESRLMCGDSTSGRDLATLMNGQKADMIFTDPPYNMNYKSHTKGGILNDNMEEEAFIDFCVAFTERLKENARTGAAFYICSGYNSYIPFRYALQATGLNFSSAIVWVKNSLGMGMNDFRHQHELILKAKKEPESKKKKAEMLLYGWNGGKHYFAGGHDEGDVWQVSRRGGNTMSHPTQKPLALINKAIKHSSKHGDLVLDLFGGSGSTLISACKTGRRAYLMELDPKYVDSIIERWEALSGEKAIKV